jgi:hypothetical protein
MINQNVADKDDLIKMLLKSRNNPNDSESDSVAPGNESVDYNEWLKQNFNGSEAQLSQLLANLEQQQKGQGQPGADASFKKIRPEPGFVLKTTNKAAKSGEKVFLNICKSAEIVAPRDITEPELIKLIETEDSAFQFRIPMSLGEPHAELDNSGCSCTAYDVCINPQFYDKIQQSSTFMGFFMSISLEGLEDKYSIKLDRNCKLLKNKRFMGQILEQNIKVKSKPLIAEVNGDKAVEEKKSATAETPKYKIFREPVEGEAEFLVCEIELPKIVFANSIILEVGEDRIVLSTRSGLYYLDVFVPFYLDQEECGAQFDKTSRVLTLTMKVARSTD